MTCTVVEVEREQANQAMAFIPFLPAMLAQARAKAPPQLRGVIETAEAHLSAVGLTEARLMEMLVALTSSDDVRMYAGNELVMRIVVK